MSDALSSTLRDLLRLSNRILESFATFPYTPHQSSSVSVEAFIQPLLEASHSSIRDFALACALLSSSSFHSSQLLSWIPNHLLSLATSSFFQLSTAYIDVFEDRNSIKVSKLGFNSEFVPKEKRLLLELMPEVLPFLKERIKETSIDKSDESDEFSAALAKVPVGFTILAAFQFRWFVTQVASFV
ncbi:hypothetical protein RJT34_16603 [Clitoria ternatea]|uniref:ARM repeat superfamily protein n=1 Tax=Clitoria ternatea TaxID=43366 RepID=A0AAN9J7E3_CLITE